MITLAALQHRAVNWAVRVFGRASVDNRQLRALRVLEEAVEFAQAVDVPLEKCANVITLVYAKPKGDPSQEIAGILFTTIVAADGIGVESTDVLIKELQRVNSFPDAHFITKQKEKVMP